MISFKVEGLNDVAKSFKEMGKESMYNDVMRQTAENAVQYAKQYAPEDTGIMADDIQARMRGKGFILECLVPWAVYNEYGTIFMPVGRPNSPKAVISSSGKYAFRPFMRPATYRAMDEMSEIFGKKVMKIWK